MQILRKNDIVYIIIGYPNNDNVGVMFGYIAQYFNSSDMKLEEEILKVPSYFLPILLYQKIKIGIKINNTRYNGCFNSIPKDQIFKDFLNRN